MPMKGQRVRRSPMNTNKKPRQSSVHKSVKPARRQRARSTPPGVPGVPGVSDGVHGVSGVPGGVSGGTVGDRLGGSGDKTYASLFEFALAEGQ